MAYEMKEHVTAAAVENVDFLVETGLSLTLACRRASISLDYYQKLKAAARARR